MAHEPDQPPPSALERKLVTILSADVASIINLMAEDEEQTLQIFREHSQTFRSLVRILIAGEHSIPQATRSWQSLRAPSKLSAARPTSRRHYAPATTSSRPRVKSSSVSASISAMS